MLALCRPAAALGQDIADNPATAAALHLGPLAVTPHLAIRNVGFDSNVLNAAGEPQPDFTFTFVPGADSWLTVARARVTSRTDAGWVYFQTMTDQRSFEFNEQARLEVLLSRIVPHVAGGYEHTRQRPNLEIDERALRTTVSGLAGITLRFGARTRIDVDAGRKTYRFDETHVQDAALALALNRTENTVTGTLRLTLTPLTTLVIKTEDEHDRFEFSPLRNSNSVLFEPGFEFKPFALLSGRASVGYRQFDALGPGVPDYSGPVAAVDLSYTMRETTRFAVSFSRDIEYSYEPTSPYYIQNGGFVSVTQALGPDWDLVGRAGRTSLGYRAIGELGTLAPGVFSRRDIVTTYGVGGGRRVGSKMRIGLDVDRTTRTSVLVGRNYTGFRIGGSATYGF
ncbi:MAG: outer membrane beta-barrel protein [Vicinamibacterales bacterium]